MLDKYIDVQLEDPLTVEVPDGDNTVMIIAPKINPFNVEETRSKVDELSKMAKRTYKNAKVWIHTDFGEMPKAIGIQPRKETDIKYGNEANKLALY
jgi:hypothetical protein